MLKQIFTSLLIVVMIFSFVSATSAYSSTIYCPSWAMHDYCYCDKIGGESEIYSLKDGSNLCDREFYSKFQFPECDYVVFYKSNLTVSIGKYYGKNYNTLTISAPDNQSYDIRLHFEFTDHSSFYLTIPNFVANNTNGEYCLDHEYKWFSVDRVYIDSLYGYYGQQHVYDNYKDSTLHRD